MPGSAGAQLRAAPGNGVCADCGALDPQWVSLNLGVVVCTGCCSVHRSMGWNASVVVPIPAPGAPVPQPANTALLETLAQIGNATANCTWEEALPAGHAKPSSTDPIDPVRQEYIQAKYGEGRFLSARDKGRGAINTMLMETVMSGNIVGTFRLLCLGANPNWFDTATKYSPLHVAAATGNRLMIELLLIRGANPMAQDHLSRTPDIAARESGYFEAAARVAMGQHEIRCAMQRFCRNHPVDVSDSDAQVTEQARQGLSRLATDDFGDLVIDCYDELSRRVAEALWQANTSPDQKNLMRVPFLPVSESLPAARQQARQKLATLSATRFGSLVADLVDESQRRESPAQHRARSCSVGPQQQHQQQQRRGAETTTALTSPSESDADPPTSKVSERVERLTTQVGDLTSTVASLSTANGELKQQLAALLSDNAALRAAQASQDEKFALLTEQLRALLARPQPAAPATTSATPVAEATTPAPAAQDSSPAAPDGYMEVAGQDPVGSTQWKASVAASTDRIIAGIQSLFAAAKAGQTAAYGPSTQAIDEAVRDLDDLFSESPVGAECIGLLRASNAQLATAVQQSETRPIMQCAYDISKHAKELIKLADSV